MKSTYRNNKIVKFIYILIFSCFYAIMLSRYIGFLKTGYDILVNL